MSIIFKPEDPWLGIHEHMMPTNLLGYPVPSPMRNLDQGSNNNPSDTGGSLQKSSIRTGISPLS